MPRTPVAAVALALACACLLAACDGERASPPRQPRQPVQQVQQVPPPEQTGRTAEPAGEPPAECSGQPCCGDPPRPCGEVIEEAIGHPCKTACDCPRPGLACHQGRCASGTVAVFCCGACPPTAPAAVVCQNRDGSIGRCGAPGPAAGP